MGLQTLYRFEEESLSGDEFEALIRFDPDHEIFAGHFPGQAVVPGVCLIHICREVASLYSGRDVLLKETGNVKFLNFIDPHKNPLVSFKGSFKQEEDNAVSLNASIFTGTVVFFKFRGVFV